MVCTFCRNATQVINSRFQKRRNSVWRRRKCLNCGRIVTTSESIDYEKSWTVVTPAAGNPKKQPKQPFLRDKLLISIHKSLGHRPEPLRDALGLAHTIIGKLDTSGAVQDGELTTTAIATLTLDTLKRFDKVAATMYQAYHADVL